MLVLQGGGALGAYQVGVYQALHEAGIEPDWVIGTSIGAINAALIAGNAPAHRMARLHEFWARVEQGSGPTCCSCFTGLAQLLGQPAHRDRSGIPSFFTPNPHRVARLARRSSASSRPRTTRTAPLRETLRELVDFDCNRSAHTRLTVGAVNVAQRRDALLRQPRERARVDHVMASGALPPAFPAVRIDGDPYWDGGIYSNTPIEAVLDDKPRRDSLIFAVNVWHQKARSRSRSGR